MALQKGTYSDMPQGAIPLSEEEAKEYQFRVIFGWKPKRDV
jgi:hypothetical protein